MARLVLLSEGLTGRAHELKVEKTTVGRLEDNAFQIPEGSVSSHHCEIIQKGMEILIRDLNSTNGTFINGQQVTEAQLRPGQILRLGNVEMRLEVGTPAPKKLPDQTMVIPQGVKLNDTQGSKPATFEGGTPFTKKSNRTTIIFIVIMGIVAAIIIGLLAFLFIKTQKM